MCKLLNSMIKIHGVIICQSLPLLTPFYRGPIVQWSIFKTDVKVNVFSGIDCWFSGPSPINSLLNVFWDSNQCVQCLYFILREMVNDAKKKKRSLH